MDDAPVMSNQGAHISPKIRRQALYTLNRSRLAELTERYELDVADRRVLSRAFHGHDLNAEEPA